jgi:hypothetical protein
MKYIIVCCKDLIEFAARVNDALDDGWRLQGGLAVTATTDHRGDFEEWFYQAMVKEET